ncbi:MAG: superoxide dismutase [Opitutaceae bacterium]|nr:superoxide dismutase [Opitutaceae bacterium]
MNSTRVDAASLSRRDALKTLGAGALLVAGLGGSAKVLAAEAPLSVAGKTVQPFTLPKLAYAYDALEPHIDARTMEIHHTKHHQAFITNANKALAAEPDLLALSGEALVSRLDRVPEPLRTTLRNNVGGHLNHSFFWESLSPKGGGAPAGKLAEAITASFGSFDAFKTQFADVAMKRFGSGWAWLVLVDGKLVVNSTANQDSPLMTGAHPVLGLDLWEHAYYLNYQNRRADYVAAFWKIVDWDVAGRRFADV